MHAQLGNIILRDWKMEDAPSIAPYANNRKIWQNLRDGFPHPYSIEDAEAFIGKVNQASPVTIFAIATETEAIGSIGLMPGSDVHRFTGELGYFLAEPFWGKGIMTGAVTIIANWGIQELGLHRVWAVPYAENLASRRVLEKAGFTCEGRLRSSAFKDGKIVDQILYSVISGKQRSKKAPIPNHPFGTTF